MKKIFRIPEIARRFSGHSAYGFIRIFRQLMWFSVTRKLWLRDVGYTLEIVLNDTKIDVTLWNNVDLATFIEVFLDEEYRWDALPELRVIVDAGANIGLTSLYFAHKYPQARIYAFEPTPNIFKQLVSNTDSYENIIPIQAALGALDDELDFYVSDSSIGNSLKKRRTGDDRVLVKVCSFATFIAQHNLTKVDLLKFDIEGAEIDLFNEQFNYNHASHYQGEIHEDIIGLPAQVFAERFPQQNFRLLPTRLAGRFIMRTSVHDKNLES